MKREEILRKTGRAGVLAGIAAFLLFGMMHGALVGGTIGVNTSRMILSNAAGFGEIVTRVSLMAGMALGAAVTCAMFVTCGLTVGRLVGYVWADGHAKDRDETRAVSLN